MRAATLALLALTIAVAFAGCTGGDDGGTQYATDPDGDGDAGSASGTITVKPNESAQPEGNETFTSP